MTSSHTIVKAEEYGNTEALVDLGVSVVRVNRSWWPGGGNASMTFMKPADEYGPAQSIRVDVSSDRVKKLIAALTDEEKNHG